MKRSLKFFSFQIFLMSAVFATAVYAQKPTPTPDETGPTKVFEVRLPVTVTTDNKKKELVAGVKGGGFQAFLDGFPQESNLFFSEKNNHPIYIRVLMETSPSTLGQLGLSQ